MGAKKKPSNLIQTEDLWTYNLQKDKIVVLLVSLILTLTAFMAPVD